MEHVELDGIVIDYEQTGDGETVLLPHARPFVRWYDPLVARLDGWRALRYRRTAVAGLTIERDADLATALLDHVGVERPHVVGHSYGGLVALALARRTAVRSLALIEPAATGLVDPATAAASSAPLLELARSSGATTAMGAFLAAVCGDRGADELERLVPGATAEALAHSDDFFARELPAVIAYDITIADVAGIAAPVLNVSGTDSAPRFAEAAAIVQAWFPQAARVDVPGATHLLPAQRPDVVADELVTFWRRISS